MLRLARWLCLALALAPLAAAAEIYQWTDEQGRIHFTQDLSQVPARHRSQAELRAMAPPEAGRLQTYSKPAAPAPGLSAGRAGAPGREVRVSVARAGTGMIVNVLLNGSVTAPFLVDTGATDVLIPASLAKRLGIEAGPESRSKSYRTANGDRHAGDRDAGLRRPRRRRRRERSRQHQPEHGDRPARALVLQSLHLPHRRRRGRPDAGPQRTSRNPAGSWAAAARRSGAPSTRICTPGSRPWTRSTAGNRPARRASASTSRSSAPPC